MDIQQIIQNDIQQIQNNGAKKQRETALIKYFQNPKFCIYCSRMIIPAVGQSLTDVRNKQFCNKSCSVSYNNSRRIVGTNGPKTFIDSCSDEDFIEAYNSSSSYNELAKSIGYTNNVSSNVKQKIVERICLLGLEEYSNRQKFDLMTKGELMSRRSNWQSWRSSIQRDARDKYKNSIKPKECIVCGYTNTYEVAHITPVADFDNNTLISEINDINNLIALCPNHHWEYDNNMIDMAQYIVH